MSINQWKKLIENETRPLGTAGTQTLIRCLTVTILCNVGEPSIVQAIAKLISSLGSP